MKVAITGSKGLIGSALTPHLRSEGHEVVRLVRGEPEAGDVLWNPKSGTIEIEKLRGVDAVVHLAGAGVGDHLWSARYKETILSSRVDGTSTLAEALSRMSDPPSVLLSASAVGYYGSRGDELLTEESGPGSGFLADVCEKWEAAASAVSGAGIRLVVARMGVVLSGAGGALKKQLPAFRLGVGARLGRGSQQLSWITRRDAVAAIAHLLRGDGPSGPINLTAPRPVSNATFTHALGHALHRPAVLAVPQAILRLVVGAEMTSEFLLASQRAVPKRLLKDGFIFADDELADALRTALGDSARVPPGG
ncbi:MAG: TIGR01777 family oxidoreductase [Acidimicrobiales bacterium]